MEYKLFYELSKSLQSESGLVPSVNLYDFADDKIYAAAMAQLAQPLPNGEQSPFSAQDPGSAHSILVGAMVYLQSLLAHEVNLIPDYSLLWWLRLHGVQMGYAQYPIISLEFVKSSYATDQNIALEIPLGTEIQSIYNPNLYAYTQETLIIPASLNRASVPARLNTLGTLPTLRIDEFTRIPLGMSFIDAVSHTAVLSAGSPAERLDQAVARLRDWLKTGDRIVTDRDALYYARLGGGQKVNPIRGYHPDIQGFRRDLRTVAVYPSSVLAAIELEMRDRRMLDERLNVIAARIIPVTGTITIKAIASISENQARALAVNAIVDQINPPYGIWGDENFESSLATAIESVPGIYAVESMVLVDERTQQSIADIGPWSLFEIQQGITIVVLR